MEKKPITHEDLRQFTGDLDRYRTLNRSVIYTPGIAYLAEHAGAYWLIDAIASYFGSSKMNRALAKDERLTLHFWRLDVADDSSATLFARADSGEKPFITQEIPYTDFPLSYADVWAAFDGTHWTLYLPSEH